MAGWWREDKRSGVVVRGGSQVFGRQLARPGSLASRDGPAGFRVDRGWARRRGRRMRADLRGLCAPDHPERGVAPDSGRVGRWRGALRVRCVTRSLSRRRQACLPQVRFHLLLTICRMPHDSPNRTCGFPAPGSRVGSCASHTEHPFEDGSDAGPRVLRGPSFQKLYGFTRVAPLRRAVRPVHAQTASRLLAPRAGRWIRGLAGFPGGVVHSGVSMQHRRRDDRAREAGACATRSRAEHAEGADRSASGGMARALDAPPGAAGASGEAAHCTR